MKRHGPLQAGLCRIGAWPLCRGLLVGRLRPSAWRRLAAFQNLLRFGRRSGSRESRAYSKPQAVLWGGQPTRGALYPPAWMTGVFLVHRGSPPTRFEDGVPARHEGLELCAPGWDPAGRGGSEPSRRAGERLCPGSARPALLSTPGADTRRHRGPSALVDASRVPAGLS